MPHSLPADLAEALATAESQLGPYAHVRHVAEVESTNDIALTLAAGGAAEGTSVLADAQRAGRGRRGRSWFSPPGAGIYLSVIVRPGAEAESLSLITLAAGVAAAEAVSACSHLPVELKWPNDLVIGRPWRKMGGLLCESAGAGARVDAVVVGMGLNLLALSYPSELADRATSIEDELGRPIARGPLVVALLDRLRHAMTRLRAGDRAGILGEWRRFGRVGLDGTPVRWQEMGEWRRGVTRDLGEDGALLVDRDGRRERLIAGEVLWERFSRE